MRNAESQGAHEDSRTVTEHAGAMAHNDLARRNVVNSELPHTELTGLPGQAPYALNFSFEELNAIGLDEAPPRHSNLSWQVNFCQIDLSFAPPVVIVVIIIINNNNKTTFPPHFKEYNLYLFLEIYILPFHNCNTTYKIKMIQNANEKQHKTSKRIQYSSIKPTKNISPSGE